MVKFLVTSVAEREGSSWVVRHLLGLSPVGFISNGALKVYHADRLGSVRWVTDGSQNIVVSYVYEGFGKIVGQNGGGFEPVNLFLALSEWERRGSCQNYIWAKGRRNFLGGEVG